MECKICQCPDPGNHLKQQCCRPCAAFFKRTVQLKLRYRCKRSGNCKLNKDNRFFCRYCRMKRCIAVGMVDHDNPDFPLSFYLDSSHYSNPSTSEEEHLPCLEENQLFTEEIVFNNYPQFLIEFKDKMREILSTSTSSSKFPFNLSMHQHATIAYEEHNAKWPNCTKEKVGKYIIFDEVLDINAIFIDTYKEFHHMAEFCMGIPQFARLQFDQKAKMLRKFASPFTFFDRMFATIELLGPDIRDTRSVHWNGHVADARKTDVDASKLCEKSDGLVKKMVDNAEDIFVSVLIEFKRLNPAHFELMYMFLSSLWNVFGPDGITKDTMEMAEEVQERLAEELFFYYKYEKKIQNYALRVYKMHNIFSAMDRIDELRAQDSQISKTFEVFNFDVHFEDLTIE